MAAVVLVEAKEMIVDKYLILFDSLVDELDAFVTLFPLTLSVVRSRYRSSLLLA